MKNNTEYIDRLIDNCNKAKNSTPIKEFVFKNLEDLKDIKRAIYIIEELNGDKEKTLMILLDIKV